MESHCGCATLSDLGWDLASCPLGVHREVILPPSRDQFLPSPGRPGFIDKAPRNQTAGTFVTVLVLVKGNPEAEDIPRQCLQAEGEGMFPSVAPAFCEV